MRDTEVILILFLFAFSGIAAASAYAADYSFTGREAGSENATIELTYTNNSDKAHCIRAFDLSSSLYQDSFSIKTKQGKSINYIGPQADAGDELIEPNTFIIVPPRDNIVIYLNLADYYKINQQEVLVEYAIPVSLCQRVLRGYFPIPFPANIKFEMNTLAEKGDKKILNYEDSYPEWWSNGFIAYLKPFAINQRNQKATR